MLNYGSRQEIIDAIKKVPDSEKESLTEEGFSEYLYTRDCPDPDILIRSSGEYRISNYMLWQLAYTEFFFLDCFWPDFGMDELCTVIGQYQRRDRRYGGVKET